MEPDSQIVIGSDGTVLAATGDLPSQMVDTNLVDCEGLSTEIRDAGVALLGRLRCSRHRVLTQSVALERGGRTVELIAIEAVPIRRTATDLRALLVSKLAILSSQAAATDLTLTITVADEVPALVYLDSEKVAWAVTTLVGNAVRYVHSGSRRKAGGTIKVGAAYRAGDGLTIEVADDGPGIPADTITRLFKRDGLDVRGAGLGLLLMFDICAAHGGTIDVRSRIDGSEHGTAVRLTLPTSVLDQPS
jgi:signal transduction histidine kinase